MDQVQLENPLSDYLPRHRDSALALARPESSFLDFFKQSLIYASPYCTDPGCCTFFGRHGGPEYSRERAALPGRNQTLHEAQRGVQVTYPLALFEELKDLPSMEVLQTLQHEFQTRYLTSVPFLAEISCMTSDCKDTPPYLLLPQALLGASLSKNPQHESMIEKLWRASTALIIGAVEVDNRLGRMIAWHTAGYLTVAFGMMQSNGHIWSLTEIVNGVSQSTLYRAGFLTNPKSKRVANRVLQNPVEPDASNLKKFCFIVDTLRSIHLQTPSTVESTWSVCIGLQAEYDFRELCDTLVVDGRLLPPELPNRDYLLILLDLISDINVLFCAIGPLTACCTSIRGPSKHTSHQREAALEAVIPPPSTPLIESTGPDYSQYLPLAADHEFHRVRAKLMCALEIWQTSFTSRDARLSNDDWVDASTLLPLLHFARLLLVAGPGIYALPSLAGYTPEENGELLARLHQPRVPHTLGLRFPQSTLHVIMELLESVESDSARRSGTTYEVQCPCEPMWYPLVLFYGALVAWSHMCDESVEKQESSRPKHFLLTTRKLLQMFGFELAKLQDDWNCARSMHSVISNLIQ